MEKSWINPLEYPFQPHFIAVEAGQMHYVDEGRGKPIVMVHGTPTWSFIYRHLIKGLSDDFRIIAPDNIGFGLSEKPENWSYRPSDHAKNLAYLIESLGLEDITLVVHDFGGPIGLAYAVENPQNVSRIIMFNTFMWSLRGDPSFERPYRLMNNFLGKTLYKRFNFSANVMIRAAWGDKRKLTREIHRHYIHALAEAKDRQGTWIFLQELIESSDWYDYLWNRRDRIQDKPALILWGMKDIAFKEKELARWESLFTTKQVIRYPEAGHFLQEEEAEKLVPVILKFLTEAGGP